MTEKPTDLSDRLIAPTESELTRFAFEIVAGSGQRGLSDDDATTALARFHEWIATAELVRLWREGHATLVWRADRRELVARAL